MNDPQTILKDPLWYKDAIIYEVRVRSFYDSNGDGIGDFAGLTSKLDYLQDLGVTALWLLPFYPSPLRDDGYDIAEYTGVHPDVGALTDFEHLLKEAHQRGVRVITELVLNHTSDQHPWFQRARRAPPGSIERDFYVWSDTPERYKDARIIFKDFEPSNWSYDPVAKAYFWHRFYSHQPDLNFENPAVQEALLKVCDFWFDKGIDGMRLDAVPYLYEQEGTNCENLPRTHEFLKKLRAHIDGKYEARMLLAEANQWPEDAAAYFGSGDECHMNFHFPIMPRMFMAMHMEDRFPILDILAQTPQIDPSCQWALFLRNHDELTLEMVTDEERDYMYSAYGQEPAMRINLGIRRRLAPLCGNDRRKMELLNGLLFSLPGTPVLYYGDEIGMGDNVFLGDRNGVRTPMQWSSDRNAGFSRANPQRMILPVVIDPEYNYETVNVEAHQNNPSSLLWWTKQLVALRKRYQAFGRGAIEFLTPENHRVLAFVREWQNERVLVVANLSRFAQYVELDLSKWKGLRTRELFGDTAFPPVGEPPYLLTLAGHGFYWFALSRPPEGSAGVDRSYQAPVVRTSVVTALLEPGERERLEEILVPYLTTRRWFNQAGRRVTETRIDDLIQLRETTVVCITASYETGEADTWILPLLVVSDGRPVAPQAIIAQLRTPTGDALLMDALQDARTARNLLSAVLEGTTATGTAGELRGLPMGSGVGAAHKIPEGDPHDVGHHHANAALQFGDQYVLKLFRRLEDGVSPELEVSAFLDKRAPGLTPEVVGVIEYQRGRREPHTLGVLQRFVPNEGTAWTQAREELRRYFERVLTQAREAQVPPVPHESLIELVGREPPRELMPLLGAYPDLAARLGRRTAEMHIALASEPNDAAFAPEPYSPFDHRARYQSFRNLVGHTLRLLRAGLDTVPPPSRDDAHRLLDGEARVLRFFDDFLRAHLEGTRIRLHGDYHLAQVLWTGKDYVLIDFDGGRGRTLADRRRKRTALRDVASMLRSFHSGAFSVLLDSSAVREEDRPTLRPWADHWQTWACAAFLRGYLDTCRNAAFLPGSPAELSLLLDRLIVERAFLDLQRDLQHGSGTAIPLRALVQTLRL